MQVLVTGGTGFIGRALCRALVDRGDGVRVLSRSAAGGAARALPGAVRVQPTPTSAAAWREALAGCDAVVNLAGEGVASGRWTSARKARIRDSRVQLTHAIVDALALCSPEQRPAVLVSASAVGFYGASGDTPLDEQAPAGADFLAQVCAAWEAEARRAETCGVRVALLRIGVVLGDGGGALERMLPPFRAFVGGPLGDGKQWMSWIHRDDVVGLILWALDHTDVRGPMNATAPAPATMNDFSATLGRVLGRPAVLRVPGFVLQLALGELAEMLLTGQRVLPRAAEGAGYRFRHPDLDGALRASVAS